MTRRRARRETPATHLTLLLLPPLLAALAGAPSRGAAQAGDFGARARVATTTAATNDEDATASGSTLRTADRRRGLEDVGEAISELPGLRVTRQGGTGDSTFVALRGADAGHTAVLLDAIPLTAPDQGAFDLSQLPLGAFERVEVYRGGAPAWYGEGSIGGVVRFVPDGAAGEQARVSVGAGSFGHRAARATTRVGSERGAAPAFFGHVRLRAADNDYPYRYDGGTRFDPDDDRTLWQGNAEVLQTDGLAHGSMRLGGGKLALVLAGHGGQQGVPGPLAAPTAYAQRKLVRALAGASYTHTGVDGAGHRGHRLQLVAAGSHQRNAFTDRIGELGRTRPVASDDVWQRGFARAAGSVRLWDMVEPSLVATVTRDRFAPDNPLATVPTPPSARTSAAVTLEPHLFGRLLGMRASLRPSVRLQWSRTEVQWRGTIERTTSEQTEWAPTYRLAAALAPNGWLSLSASAATGVRLPSIAELFGDRVFQEENPRLSPERANMLDAGVVACGAIGPVHGSAELRGFATEVEDLIRFQRTAQFTVRPENIARARILGTELGVQGRVGRHFRMSASATAMDTENAAGRELPLRPPLQILARPELRLFPGLLDMLSAYGEVHHLSFAYLDDANLTHLPARTTFSSGLSLTFWGGRLHVDARVLNILDARFSDLLSRPLPGRRFEVMLTWAAHALSDP